MAVAAYPTLGCLLETTGLAGDLHTNAVASEVSRESRAVEIRCCRPVERRTVLVQRGLYTTMSQVRQCQLRCPPPPWPRPATCRRGTWFAPSGCPLGHRSRGQFRTFSVISHLGWAGGWQPANRIAESVTSHARSWSTSLAKPPTNMSFLVWWLATAVLTCSYWLGGLHANESCLGAVGSRHAAEASLSPHSGFRCTWASPVAASLGSTRIT
jgi:hypothetical protein